jgi:integrase
MHCVVDWKGTQAMTVARDRGTWRYRTTAYYADGTSIRIWGSAPRYENTRDKALALEAEHVKRIRALMPGQEEATNHSGTSASADAPKPPVPTVAEFAPTYLDACRINLKHSTMRTKECDFRTHILPMLGDLRLDEVTYAVLEDFKAKLTKKQSANTTHKPRLLTPKSVHHLQLHVSALLRSAKKHGHIREMPEIDWIKVPTPEFDFLTFEEARRLVSGPRDEWRTMIFVGLRTGLRRGELAGLRWIDVDLDAGRILVRQAYVKGHFVTPKSGKPREVPLGDEVIEELRIHRHERGPLVFCDHEGKPFTEGQMMWPLERARRNAGLRPLKWHMLRHTFASHLAMRGKPIKVIQEILGHSSIDTTMIYAHLSPEVARDAVKSLDRLPAPTAPPSAAPATATSRKKSATKSRRSPASSKIPDEVAKNWRNSSETPLSN